jgi:YfiH family protein
VCYIHNLGAQEFRTVARGGLAWLECTPFSRIPWIAHGFSTRLGGVSRRPSEGLNLGFTESDERQRVERNREMFLAKLGASGFTLASLRQIHSSHVYQVTRDAGGRLEYRPCGFALPEQPKEKPPAGDGLMTQEAGILLTVRVADCLPVLLADPKRRTVCAVHAGWRGALEQIVEKAVGEMRRILSSAPEDLLAALGPSIRSCCYEVGEEVVDAFFGRFPHAEKFLRKSTNPSTASADRYPTFFLSSCRPRHGPASAPVTYLDLVAALRDQLLSVGVDPRRIYVSEFCTACRTDLFFSHRKEGGGTGRLMGMIGIRPERSR